MADLTSKIEVHMRVYRSNFTAVISMLLVFCWAASPVRIPAQTPAKSPEAKPAEKEKPRFTDSESEESQRRVFAISLITSLADEAHSAPERSKCKLDRRGEEFGLAGVLRLLTKQDLYQSLSLAKSFTNEAAKAAAVLAVGRSALEN